MLDISTYLANPSLIGEQEIKLLTNELELMPWCSTYRMLLAKGYDNENSFQKNKHLRLAATYAGDRESLFMLIHNQAQAANLSNKIIEVVEEQQKIEEKEVAAQNTPKEEVEEQEIAVQDIESEEVAKVVVEKEEEEATEEVSVVVEPEEIPESVQQIEPVEEKDVEEEQEVEVKESKIDFEEIVTYDPIKELQSVEAPAERDRTEIDFDYVAYDPEMELNKLIEEKEEEDEHDFMFWLNNVEDKSEKQKKSKLSPKSPDKVQDLLDQFLATKRTRPIQNRQFYNAQNKAEESETDTMDVVSETLLELYVKQGHVQKAIEGYQKLSLQNPTKTTYFAARITELQELNKEQ